MKKKTIKFVAAVMAAAMMFAGCGSSSSGESSSKQDEVQKVVFATWTINTLPEQSEIERVQEKINEITVDEYGIEVELRLYPVSEYFQKVSLALQSGDQIDVFTSYGNFPTAVSQEMCYDITDLVDEYCAGAVDKIADGWLEACTVNGSVYGIPTWMPQALATNIVYRTDIAEELEIDMTQVDDIDELTDVLRQVKAAYPEMTPIIGGTTSYGGMSSLTLSIPEIDYLGDSNNYPAGVLMGDDDTVVDLFQTEEYAKRMQTARTWHEEGLIMQDMATTTLTNVEIMSGGNVFANMTLQGSDPTSVANSFSSQTGYPYASIYIGNSYLDTASVNYNAWCVSSTCEAPEAALTFMNLIYTNSDIINYIVYGIEGEDYVVQEDGTIAVPEGMDASSVPYPGFYILAGSWSMGDMYRMAGTTEEAIQWNIDANNNAVNSDALGFTFDGSALTTQYTAVDNVIAQYYSALDCGSVDPETELPKFIEALKNAGLDDIIAAKQEQLDAWKSSK